MSLNFCLCFSLHLWWGEFISRCLNNVDLCNFYAYSMMIQRCSALCMILFFNDKSIFSLIIILLQINDYTFFNFLAFFSQIQLVLGRDSSIAVGWQKKDDKSSAAGEVKVFFFDTIIWLLISQIMQAKKTSLILQSIASFHNLSLILFISMMWSSSFIIFLCSLVHLLLVYPVIILINFLQNHTDELLEELEGCEQFLIGHFTLFTILI